MIIQLFQSDNSISEANQINILPSSLNRFQMQIQRKLAEKEGNCSVPPAFRIEKAGTRKKNYLLHLQY